MFGRLILYGALALAIGIVVVSACGPEPQTQGLATPTPATSASRPVTPSTAPTSLATATTRPSPSVSSAPTVAPSPGSSPAAACPRSTGGDPSNQAQLVAVRVGHQPGFDRLVFEFAQSAAPGTFGIPAYTIEAASSLSGPSGQPVTINGQSGASDHYNYTVTGTFKGKSVKGTFQEKDDIYDPSGNLYGSCSTTGVTYKAKRK